MTKNVPTYELEEVESGQDFGTDYLYDLRHAMPVTVK